MTEEAKQTMLLLFQAIQRHGEPEAEVQCFQAIHNQLLRDLSQQLPSELRTQLLALPEQLLRLMAETCAKIARTDRLIAYIEQTPAAALTREAVLRIV